MVETHCAVCEHCEALTASSSVARAREKVAWCSGRFRRKFVEARKANMNPAQPARDEAPSLKGNKRVPRVLHLMWDYPDTAPDLVTACLKSWRDLNYGWEIYVWDDFQARRARSHFTRYELPVQATSDCLRLKKLSETGGVWVDATVFPIAPLDEWIDDALGPYGFFAPSAPGPDRLVSSWFLAAEQDSPVIDAWKAAAEIYWNGKHAAVLELTDYESPIDASLELSKIERVPYYWVHYLYNSIFFNQPLVRKNHG